VSLSCWQAKPDPTDNKYEAQERKLRAFLRNSEYTYPKLSALIALIEGAVFLAKTPFIGF